jgi:hypothetical protein
MVFHKINRCTGTQQRMRCDFVPFTRRQVQQGQRDVTVVQFGLKIPAPCDPVVQELHVPSPGRVDGTFYLWGYSGVLLVFGLGKGSGRVVVC